MIALQLDDAVLHRAAGPAAPAQLAADVVQLARREAVHERHGARAAALAKDADNAVVGKAGFRASIIHGSLGDVTSRSRNDAPATAGRAAAVAELAAFGRFAAERGWVPATAGNFSRRLDADRVLVTRSGVDKGALGDADLVTVSLLGPLPAGVSAETPLHVARYRADAAVGAVVHVHTVAATILSRACEAERRIRFGGYEMQKAFAGIATHAGEVDLPIFANDQDTVALADRVEATLGARPAVPAYLLAGHGVYTWGATLGDARRHLEAIDFLLQCTLEERRLHR